MINTDEHGAIGQPQSDGSLEFGDSAVWTGHYKYLTGAKRPKMSYFEISSGSYVRHPDPIKTNNGFGAVPQCMSRDQYVGVLAGLISENNIKGIFNAILNHSKHIFLFAFNTIHNGKSPKKAKWKIPDLTLFDVWAIYYRGLGDFKWLYYPVLIILDIHMLLNTLVFNYFDKDNDQINFAIKHFIQIEHAPTPTSWLAWKILNKKKLIKLINSYWNGWRKNPDMAKLYIDRIIKCDA